jgi:hypothetical protein
MVLKMRKHLCGELGPLTYYCTECLGHNGDHVAMDGANVCEIWPNTQTTAVCKHCSKAIKPCGSACNYKNECTAHKGKTFSGLQFKGFIHLCDNQHSCKGAETIAESAEKITEPSDKIVKTKKNDKHFQIHGVNGKLKETDSLMLELDYDAVMALRIILGAIGGTNTPYGKITLGLWDALSCITNMENSTAMTYYKNAGIHFVK